jgi:hypothetical protein
MQVTLGIPDALACQLRADDKYPDRNSVTHKY